MNEAPKANRPSRRSFLSLPAAALLSVLAGCSSAPKAKPYSWQIAPKTTASIRVDVIGVNEASKAKWQELKIDDYWRPGDNFRRDAQSGPTYLSFRFPEDKAKAAMDKKDPLWQSWLARGVRYLVVVADLPGGQQATEGRRQIIPLNRKDNPGSILDIEVRDASIEVIVRKK